MSKFTTEEKLVVLDRHIITLKQMWADRLKRKEEYAVHHLAVLKAIATDLRGAAPTPKMDGADQCEKCHRPLRELGMFYCENCKYTIDEQVRIGEAARHPERSGDGKAP
jgi:hypothetical protein